MIRQKFTQLSLGLLIAAGSTLQAQNSVVFEDSFESGDLSGWTMNEAVSLLTNRDFVKGAYSAEIVSGGKIQKVIPLKGNSKYRLTAFIRTTVGAEEIQINIDGLKQNNVGLASALTAWTEKELVFQTAEKQQQAIIEIYHPFSFSGNSAWVDEIKVYYLGDASFEKPQGLNPLPARNTKEDLGIIQQSLEKMEWFLDGKFGMFIHWGLYAGAAQGEWYMRNKGIGISDYRKLAYPESAGQYFAADQFNPSEWTALAKEAGMTYMNLTTQHHDGYALFDSKYPDAFTSYQTHNRDFVKEYVEACRAAGLKVGLYKTLINWRYPGYYDVMGTDCQKNSWGYTTQPSHKENARQMKEELYCMTRELLSNYGKIDYMFWDGAWLAEQGSDAAGAYFWESGKYLDPSNQWPVESKYTLPDTLTGKLLGLMGMVRQLQPDILVNPRCGWRGDLSCEEGGAKISGPVRSNEIYEKCLSLHFSWGYTPLAENPAKIVNAARVKRYLTDCLMRNMCLMVNVGPDRHGRIPEAEANVLREVGKWINQVEEAVYGTRGGPWNPVDEQYGFSYKGNTIYVYLLDGYETDSFLLPAIGRHKVVRAYEVGSNRRLSHSKQKDGEIKIADLPLKNSDGVRIIGIELNKNVL